MSTTLQNVIDRITLDYLNRTDLDSQAIRAVQAAIRQYERQRFPWNEATLTITAVSGQSYIDVPTDFLTIDRLEVQFQSATYAMNRRDFDSIRDMNTATVPSNLPTDYALRANRFELFPTPDSAYLLNCYYLKQLTALTATSMLGTNDWLSAAEDVIVYHATKLMWANVLRNTEEAQKCYQLEQTAKSELQAFRSQQVTHRIKPSSF